MSLKGKILCQYAFSASVPWKNIWKYFVIEILSVKYIIVKNKWSAETLPLRNNSFTADNTVYVENTIWNK